MRTVKRWALWQAPRRVIALVVSVEALAVIYGASALLREQITSADLLRLGLLVLLSVVYVEVSRQVEHRRRLFAPAHSSHMDMSSVWAFAGAVVLPRGLAAVLVVAFYGHLWLRSWRSVDGIKPHRVAYTAAVIAVSAFTASSAAALDLGDRLPQPAILLAALAVGVVAFRAANAALISSAILISPGKPTRAALLGSRSDNVMEFSTLVLAAALGVSVVTVPWFAVMVLPAVFLLQYHALLRDLVAAATVDGKTELLNASAWRQLAQRELNRAQRQSTGTAVLVIDMDHFKRINDVHGHLAGDTALRAVADALADELRGYDAVGRFGGEEFVALLPAVDAETAQGVAQRVRRRIETTAVVVERRGEPGVTSLTLTASIGMACAPGHGTELDDLLGAADHALYAAKAGGRNMVCVATADARVTA